MLRWMGGSRREVISSRKSTHKRQKQYFEQRKQQQQEAGLENHADGRHSCIQHHGNERSLDILSFSNLSTVTQEQKSSCLAVQGRDSPQDHTSSLKYQSAHHSPTIDKKKVVSAGHSQTNEAKHSPVLALPFLSSDSLDHVETIRPKKFLVSPLDEKEGLSENSDKFKSAAQCHEISVIDLLGEVGAHGNAEEVLVPAQESHVAFSVEGLGKVGSETPIQSPCRSFPRGISSLDKTRRKGSTTKNFYYCLDDFEPQMDAMVDDVDFSLYDDSIAQPLCSQDNVFGNPKPRFSNFRKSLSFDGNGNSLNDVLGDDIILDESEDLIQNIWSGGSAFPSDYVDNVGECELLCKNQADLVDHGYGYAHYLNNSEYDWGRDLHFEDYSLQESRKHRTENIGFLDLDSSYTKNHISDYLHDFERSIGRWYSTIGREHTIKNPSNPPARCSSFIREHGRESLSEESCSSSAVWGDQIKRSPRRNQGTKVQGTFGGTQKKKCYEKNIQGKERNCRNLSNLQQRESIDRLGNFNMMSEACPKPGCFDPTFRSSLVCQTSGMKEHASSGPSAWIKDFHDATSDPRPMVDSSSPFKQSAKLPSHQHSPISEKRYFCQPFDHGYSYETPVSQNNVFISIIPNASRESKGNKVVDSLHTLNYMERDKESFSTDGENNIDVPSVVEGNIDLQMDVFGVSRDMSSKMESPSVSPNRTPEVKESLKGANSTNLAEDTSSSVEMPSNSGGIQMYQDDMDILLPWRTESQEVIGPKEMKARSFGRGNNGDSSYR